MSTDRVEIYLESFNSNFSWVQMNLALSDLKNMTLFRQIPTNLKTIVRKIESIELKLSKVNLDKAFNNVFEKFWFYIAGLKTWCSLQTIEKLLNEQILLSSLFNSVCCPMSSGLSDNDTEQTELYFMENICN